MSLNCLIQYSLACPRSGKENLCVSVSAMDRAMAREEVAAGEGALRQCKTRPDSGDDYGELSEKRFTMFSMTSCRASYSLLEACQTRSPRRGRRRGSWPWRGRRRGRGRCRWQSPKARTSAVLSLGYENYHQQSHNKAIAWSKVGQFT